MSEIYEDKEKCEAETGREYDRIKIERDESQQRFRTACGLRLKRSKRNQKERRTESGDK